MDAGRHEWVLGAMNQKGAVALHTQFTDNLQGSSVKTPVKTVSVLLIASRLSDSAPVADLLERAEGIRFTSCFTNPVVAAAEAKPDVSVIDVTDPSASCFELARVIRQNHPDCRVMIIGADGSDRSIQDALDVGVRSYLTNQEPPGAVLSAIREVAAGRAVFSGRVCKRLAVSWEGSCRPEARRHLLTPRELEIARFIGMGFSDKEVAVIAKISIKTVEAHCAHIRSKLGLRGRVDIARFAFREGLTSA